MLDRDQKQVPDKEVRGWLADNSLETTVSHEVEADVSVRAQRA